MNKQDFVLNATIASSDNGDFRFIFDEPITIKPNSTIVVYWANVQVAAPQADYLKNGFIIYIKLPTNTMTNSNDQDENAFKKSIFLAIPPATQADNSGDDPAGLPLVSNYTYEPFTPVVHEMENQEQQITSLSFQIVDLITQEPAPINITPATGVSISFCIKPSMENNM